MRASGQTRLFIGCKIRPVDLRKRTESIRQMSWATPDPPMSTAGMLRPSHRYRSDRRTMPASGSMPHRPQPDGFVLFRRTSGTGILSHREGWAGYRLGVASPEKLGCQGFQGGEWPVHPTGLGRFRIRSRSHIRLTDVCRHQHHLPPATSPYTLM